MIIKAKKVNYCISFIWSYLYQRGGKCLPWNLQFIRVNCDYGAYLLRRACACRLDNTERSGTKPEHSCWVHTVSNCNAWFLYTSVGITIHLLLMCVRIKSISVLIRVTERTGRGFESHLGRGYRSMTFLYLCYSF